VKVFVTGGAGYIGSIYVEQLLDRGNEVVVFDNLSEGHRESIDPRATFMQGDLNDPKSISLAIKLAGPSAGMHPAASAGRSIPAIEKARRPGDPPRLAATSDKAKPEFNWDPQFADIEPIVERAWQRHAAHPNG
jgi:UDP-glucose 4-epimerase